MSILIKDIGDKRSLESEKRAEGRKEKADQEACST